MKTIALETSTQPGQLALLQDDNVVYDATLTARRRTTEAFAWQLDAALRDVDWAPSEVQLFAVCEGPGSFTGLRIGVTAAKTFAYATGCQLVALNSLELLAHQAGQDESSVWAVIDAQRQQLFVAQYGWEAHRLIELTKTHIVPTREWLSQLPVGTRVTGPGLRSREPWLGPGITVTPAACWTLQASLLGRVAVAQARRGVVNDLWRLAPSYYRPSAAEEKRTRTPDGIADPRDPDRGHFKPS